MIQGKASRPHLLLVLLHQYIQHRLTGFSVTLHVVLGYDLTKRSHIKAFLGFLRTCKSESYESTECSFSCTLMEVSPFFLFLVGHGDVIVGLSMVINK